MAFAQGQQLRPTRATGTQLIQSEGGVGSYPGRGAQVLPQELSFQRNFQPGIIRPARTQSAISKNRVLPFRGLQDVPYPGEGYGNPDYRPQQHRPSASQQALFQHLGQGQGRGSPRLRRRTASSFQNQAALQTAQALPEELMEVAPAGTVETVPIGQGPFAGFETPAAVAPGFIPGAGIPTTATRYACSGGMSNYAAASNTRRRNSGSPTRGRRGGYNAAAAGQFGGRNTYAAAGQFGGRNNYAAATFAAAGRRNTVNAANYAAAAAAGRRNTVNYAAAAATNRRNSFGNQGAAAGFGRGAGYAQYAANYNPNSRFNRQSAYNGQQGNWNGAAATRRRNSRNNYAAAGQFGYY